jgi:hypothetical protein
MCVFTSLLEIEGEAGVLSRHLAMRADPTADRARATVDIAVTSHMVI